MNPEQMDFLLKAARQYVWWKTPEEALFYPARVIAQIMNIGDWDDLCRLTELFTKQELADVLKNAEIGQFNPRSWSFWSYRLIGDIPEMPRRFA